MDGWLGAGPDQHQSWAVSHSMRNQLPSGEAGEDLDPPNEALVVEVLILGRKITRFLKV